MSKHVDKPSQQLNILMANLNCNGGDVNRKKETFLNDGKPLKHPVIGKLQTLAKMSINDGVQVAHKPNVYMIPLRAMAQQQVPRRRHAVSRRVSRLTRARSQTPDKQSPLISQLFNNGTVDDNSINYHWTTSKKEQDKFNPKKKK